jgi:hypothetical protein
VLASLLLLNFLPHPFLLLLEPCTRFKVCSKATSSPGLPSTCSDCAAHLPLSVSSFANPNIRQSWPQFCCCCHLERCCAELPSNYCRRPPDVYDQVELPARRVGSLLGICWFASAGREFRGLRCSSCRRS